LGTIGPFTTAVVGDEPSHFVKRKLQVRARAELPGNPEQISGFAQLLRARVTALRAVIQIPASLFSKGARHMTGDRCGTLKQLIKHGRTSINKWVSVQKKGKNLCAVNSKRPIR
jgi:hypothetical protein